MLRSSNVLSSSSDGCSVSSHCTLRRVLLPDLRIPPGGLVALSCSGDGAEGGSALREAAGWSSVRESMARKSRAGAGGCYQIVRTRAAHRRHRAGVAVQLFWMRKTAEATGKTIDAKAVPRTHIQKDGEQATR